MTIVAQWSAVTKRYRGVTAVEGVSLGLEAGQVTALVGHNGAGTTTLIKLLLGLIRPTEGSVRISGIDPAGNRGAEARRAIGFLPESVAFHGAMTGSELMAFHARLKGESCRGNAALLERVGIAHAANRRVATYSKGMRQRLGIAHLLMMSGAFSLSLGIFNLLPIPILDGGALLYYLIELAKGSPVSERVQIAGQYVGLALLVALMGLALYNDILRHVS